MPLEARQLLLLNRNDDLVALQQTGRAVMRGTNPEYPWLLVHEKKVYPQITQMGGGLRVVGKLFLLPLSSFRSALWQPGRLRYKTGKLSCRQIRDDRSSGK